MPGFHCSSKFHDGDRLIRYRKDIYALRVEMYRLDGKHRLGSHTVRHVCRQCASKELDEVRGMTPEQIDSLF